MFSSDFHRSADDLTLGHRSAEDLPLGHDLRVPVFSFSLLTDASAFVCADRVNYELLLFYVQ